MLSLLFLYTNVTYMHCSAQLLHAALSPEAMCILCGDAYFTALKKLLRNLDGHDDCIVSITAFPRMRRTYRKFWNIVKRIPACARSRFEGCDHDFSSTIHFCAIGSDMKALKPRNGVPLHRWHSLFLSFFFFFKRL